MKKITRDQLNSAQRESFDRIVAAAHTPAVRAEEQSDRETELRNPIRLTPEEWDEYQAARRATCGDSTEGLTSLHEALATMQLARVIRRITLDQLEETTGLDKGFLSKLENGRLTNPTVQTLERYARGLGMRLVFGVEEIPRAAGDEDRGSGDKDQVD